METQEIKETQASILWYPQQILRSTQNMYINLKGMHPERMKQPEYIWQKEKRSRTTRVREETDTSIVFSWDLCLTYSPSNMGSVCGTEGSILPSTMWRLCSSIYGVGLSPLTAFFLSWIKIPIIPKSILHDNPFSIFYTDWWIYLSLYQHLFTHSLDSW